MLKMFSVCPAKSSAKAAPAIDRGRIVSTVTGCRNELNCFELVEEAWDAPPPPPPEPVVPRNARRRLAVVPES
ncbi:hypothetical protein WME91_03380 [Sorangium sp. So ce269]